MEKNNFGGRRSSDSNRSDSPKKSFGGRSNDRPSFGGDRKPFDRDKKPFDRDAPRPSFGGDRKPFDRDKKPFDRDAPRPSFGGDRKPFDRDRKPFDRDAPRPSFGGDRKPFDRDRKPFDRDAPRPSFGGDRKPFDRDKKPFDRDAPRPSFGGDRKPFDRDRKPFDRDAPRPPRSFDGDRKPFDRDSRPARSFDGERKPFDRDSRPARSFDGERKPFDRDSRPARSFDGDRKPFDRDAPRPARSFDGERKPFDRDSRPARSFDGDRKPFDRDSRPARSFDGDRKPFDRDAPRPARSFDGERKPFDRDSRPARSFDGDAAPRERRTFKKEIGSVRFEEKNTERPSDDEAKVEKSLERKAKISTDNPQFRKSSFERDQIEGLVKRKDKGNDEMRLNRYISHAGVCSRRDADELIRTEQVSINGKVVTEMGYQVKADDVVKLNNKLLTPQRFVYVLLNKPKDFITTTEDPNERRTVMDLVAGATDLRIYPVGRLDRNTTGLLLLTNDGDLADKMTHPSNEIRKVYQAELDKKITEEHVEALKNGIQLEDGLIKANDIAIITPDAQVIGIEIHSGRNRIVRRMFEHLGYEVQKLDRTMFGSLTKKELPRGEWRYLSEREIVRLKTLK